MTAAFTYRHDGLAKESPAPDDVFGEQLSDDDADVRAVDLIDEAVDGFFESLPGQALERWRRFVGDLLLHQTQLGRRNVGATCPSRQQVFHLL